MLKGILFDSGSTLFNFDGRWPEVFSEANQVLLATLQDAGLALDATFLLHYQSAMRAYYARRESEFIEYTAGHLLREALREFGVAQAPDGLIDTALRARYAVSEAHWRPMPDLAQRLASPFSAN